MKIKNYLVVGLALVACGNAFGAEGAGQEELKKKTAAMLSQQERQQLLNEALHRVETVEEFENLIACGAEIEKLSIIDAPNVCKYTSLLGGVVCRAGASQDLIHAVVSKLGLTSWGEIVIFKKMVEREDCPIFLQLYKCYKPGSIKRRNSLDRLRKKCIELVKVGCPLADRQKTERTCNGCTQTELSGTFASQAIADLVYYATQSPVRYIANREQFMYPLTMCKAVYEVSYGPSIAMKKQLLEVLPMLPKALIEQILYSYFYPTQEVAEIQKLHEFFNEPVTQDFMQKLAEAEKKESAQLTLA